MSQNQHHYGFFDNPPNMGSQKKTGHFSDNFNENFEPIFQSPNRSSSYQYDNQNQGLEWRQSLPQTSGNDMFNMYQESRIPNFTKSLFGKTTFVVGRRKSGKTTLIKELARREIELLKNQSIINNFTKVIIMSKSKENYQYYNNMNEETLQGWESSEFQDNLDNLVKQVHEDVIDNSLIIIEDDIEIDEFFKSPQVIKNFFSDVQKRNITLIIALTGLPKINSQISSSADYLFLCKSLPYCELQRIGNAFLSIKLASFIRIYTEIVVNNNSIAVVDISPENLRPNHKDNLKQHNMMKLLYKYHTRFSSNTPLNNNLNNNLNRNLNDNSELNEHFKVIEMNDNSDINTIKNNSLKTLIDENFKVVEMKANEKNHTSINNTSQLLEKTIINTLDDVVFNLNLLKDQLTKYFKDKSST